MRSVRPIRYAGFQPLTPTPWLALVAAAVFSVALWLGVETALGRFTHPAYPEMIRAAHTMQSAMQVAREQRTRLGLMQDLVTDPNQTGFIGSEYTDQTTSLGDLPAKRTATNPDLAAAMVRHIADLGLPEGSPVALLFSGSFIGGNVAAIIAVETLGLKPVIISSLGASMHGATDAALTWLDIEAELRARGIIAAKSVAALIGGGSAKGGGLSEEGVAALRAAALRNGVELLDEGSTGELIEKVEALFDAGTGGAPRLFVNSGGSVAALGTCLDGDRLPVMTTSGQLPCTDGIAGLVVRSANRGLPVVHLLNMREVAARWGLPFDPYPLPMVGNNRAVYGLPRE